MKSTYPNINVSHVYKKFQHYYHGKTYSNQYMDDKFREWCVRERPSVNDDTLAKLRAEYE